MALLRDSVRAQDGTLIVFTVDGRGPALMLTNGLTTTDTFWKYLRPHLIPHYTVICWDLPGHGLSEPARTANTCTIEAQPAIVVKILDKLGIERAAHVGFSMGCQVVLESMRQYPERFQALILLFGAGGHVFSTTKLPLSGATLLRILRTTPDAQFAKLFSAFSKAANLKLSRHAALALGLFGKRARPEDLAEVTRHLERLDANTMRRMAASAEAHSALDLLPELTIPVLIAAGSRDPFAPPESVGEPMHRAAPMSEYVCFDGATHTALLEHPRLIAQTVEDFLARNVASLPTP